MAINFQKLLGAVVIFLSLISVAFPQEVSHYLLTAGLALSGAVHFYYSSSSNSEQEVQTTQNA
jgi:hypothetical protein